MERSFIINVSAKTASAEKAFDRLGAKYEKLEDGVIKVHMIYDQSNKDDVFSALQGLADSNPELLVQINYDLQESLLQEKLKELTSLKDLSSALADPDPGPLQDYANKMLDEIESGLKSGVDKSRFTEAFKTITDIDALGLEYFGDQWGYEVSDRLMDVGEKLNSDARKYVANTDDLVENFEDGIASKISKTQTIIDGIKLQLEDLRAKGAVPDQGELDFTGVNKSAEAVASSVESVKESTSALNEELEKTSQSSEEAFSEKDALDYEDVIGRIIEKLASLSDMDMGREGSAEFSENLKSALSYLERIASLYNNSGAIKDMITGWLSSDSDMLKTYGAKHLKERSAIIDNNGKIWGGYAYGEDDSTGNKHATISRIRQGGAIPYINFHSHSSSNYSSASVATKHEDGSLHGDILSFYRDYIDDEISKQVVVAKKQALVFDTKGFFEKHSDIDFGSQDVLKKLGEARDSILEETIGKYRDYFLGEMAGDKWSESLQALVNEISQNTGVKLDSGKFISDVTSNLKTSLNFEDALDKAVSMQSLTEEASEKLIDYLVENFDASTFKQQMLGLETKLTSQDTRDFALSQILPDIFTKALGIEDLSSFIKSYSIEDFLTSGIKTLGISEAFSSEGDIVSGLRGLLAEIESGLSSQSESSSALSEAAAKVTESEKELSDQIQQRADEVNEASTVLSTAEGTAQDSELQTTEVATQESQPNDGTLSSAAKEVSENEAELVKQLQQKEQELSEAKAKLDDATSEYDSTVRWANTTLDENRSLADENDTLLGELEELRGQIEAADERLEENRKFYNEELGRLKEAVNRLTQDNNKLEEDNQYWQNSSVQWQLDSESGNIENQKLRAENDQLTTQISDVKNNLDSATQSLNEYAAALELATSRVSALESELHDARRATEDADYKRMVAEDVQNDAEIALEQAQKDIEAQNEVISRLKEENESLKGNTSNGNNQSQIGNADEKSNFDAVAESALAAASAKELFNEQNQNLQEIVQGSKSALGDEATYFDRLTDSGLNAATAKELFTEANIKLGTSIESVLPGLKSEAELLDKISKSDAYTPNGEATQNRSYVKGATKRDMTGVNNLFEKINGDDYLKNLYGESITDLKQAFENFNPKTDNIDSLREKLQKLKDDVSKTADSVKAESKKIIDGFKDLKSITPDFLKALSGDGSKEFIDDYLQKYKDLKKAADEFASKHGEIPSAMQKSMSSYDTYITRYLGSGRTLYDSVNKALSSAGITDEYRGRLEGIKKSLADLISFLDTPKKPNGLFDFNAIEGYVKTIKIAKQELGDFKNKEQNLETTSTVDKLIGKINNDLHYKMPSGLRSEFEELLNALQQVREGSDSVSDGFSAISKADFSKAVAQFNNLTAKLNEFGKNNKFNSQLTSALTNQAAQLTARFFSFYSIIRYAKQIASSVTEVNSALTELRKVSEESTSRLQQSFQNSAKTAQELGATITEVINSTSDWARLGYNIDQAESLARVTQLYKNVGDDMTQESASESLISTLKGFQMDASEAEGIVDKFNEVANNYAINTAGIGEALQRSASAFNTAHTSLDKSIALITATNTVLQNPEQVGTLWNTMSARLRGAKTELEDLNEETDEYTQTTSKLRDLVKSLTGFDIMIDENNYRDLYDIIIGISKEWKNLTDIERASLGEALAGKRNSKGLFAVLDNIDTLEGAYHTALGSAGSAAREQEAYAQSVQYSIDRTKASLQELSTNFLSSDLLKSIVEDANRLLQIINKIVDKLGSIGSIVGTFLGMDLIKGALSGGTKGIIGPMFADIASQKGYSTNNMFKNMAIAFGAQRGTGIASSFLDIGEDAGKRTGTVFVKGMGDAIVRDSGIVVPASPIINSAKKVGVDAGKAAGEVAAKTTGASFIGSLSTTAWLGIGAAIAGAIAIGVSAYKARQKELLDDAKNAARKWSNQRQSLDESFTSASKLRNKLDNDDTLNESERLEIKKQIYEIQQQITTEYGNQNGAINLVNGNLQTQLSLLEKISQEEATRNLRENREAYRVLEREMQDNYGGKAIETLAGTAGTEYSKAFQVGINDALSRSGAKVFKTFMNRKNGGLSFSIVDGATMKDVAEDAELFLQQLDALEDRARNAGNLKLVENIKTVEDQIMSLTRSARKKWDENRSAYENMMDARFVAVGGEKYARAVRSAMDSVNEAIDSGESEKIANSIDTYNNAIQELRDFGGKINGFDTESYIASITSGFNQAAIKAFEFKQQLDDFAGVSDKKVKIDLEIKSNADEIENEYQKVLPIFNNQFKDTKFKSGEPTPESQLILDPSKLTPELADDAIAVLQKSEYSTKQKQPFFDYYNKFKNYYKKNKELKERATKLFDDYDSDLVEFSNKVKNAGLDVVDFDLMMDDLAITTDNEAEPALQRIAKAFDVTFDGTSDDAQRIEVLKNVLVELGWIVDNVTDRSSVAANKFKEFTNEFSKTYSSIDTVNSALANAVTGKGLSVEFDDDGKIAGDIGNIINAYEKLDDFHPGDIFRVTANGVKINTEAMRKLQKEQDRITRSKFLQQQKQLTNDLATAEKNRAMATRDDMRRQYEKEIETLKTEISQLDYLQAAYEGATSAYQQWLNAQSAGEEGDVYDNMRDTMVKRADELYKAGLVGTEEFRKIAQVISGKDLTTASIDDVVSAYKNLDVAISGTDKKVRDFFKEGSDGCLNFIDAMVDLGVATEENGVVKFEELDTEAFAKKLGTSVDIVEALLGKLKDYGFEIKWLTKEQRKQLNEFDKQYSFYNKNLRNQEFAGMKFDLDELDTVEELQSAIDSVKRMLADPMQYDIDTSQAEALNELLTVLIEKRNILERPTTVEDFDVAQYREAKKGLALINGEIKEINESGLDLQLSDEAKEYAEWIQTLPDDIKKKLNIEITGSTEELLAWLGYGREKRQANPNVVKPAKATEYQQRQIVNTTENRNTTVNKEITDSETHTSVTVDDSDVDESKKKWDEAKEDVESGAHGTITERIEGKERLDELNKAKEEADEDVDADVDVHVKGAEKLRPTKSFIDSFNDKSVRLSIETQGVTALQEAFNKWKSFVPNATKKQFLEIHTKHITDYYEKPGTVNGTAHAFGTIQGFAHAGGKWGLPNDQNALINEVGPEIVVRGSNWFIPNGGRPTMGYPLKKGDIIFNAKQSEELLKNGYVAHGYAKASGTAGGPAHADTGGSGPLEHLKRGKTNASDSDKKSNEKAAKSSEKAAKSSENAAKSSEETADNLKDWVEVLLNRIAKTFEDFKSMADYWTTYINKNRELNNAINQAFKNITDNQKAYQRYMQEANKVGLSDAYKKKVQNGELNIENIKDEKLREKVEKYTEWYDKALACKDTIRDLNKEVYELSRQKIENLIEDYESFNEYTQAAYENASKLNELYTKRIGRGNKNNLAQMAKQQNNLYVEYAHAYKRIQDEMNAQLANGTMKKNSEAYRKARTDLVNLKNAMLDVEMEIYNINEAIREVNWKNWENALKMLEHVDSQIGSTIDLISDLNNYNEDNARITDAGIAKYDLYSSALANARQKVANLNKAITTLDKEYKEGIINEQEYTEQMQEYRQQQMAAAGEVKKHRDAIISLIKEGIEAETRAMEKLTDARKEALKKQKEADDYARTVSDKTSEINKIRAKIAAMSGDETMATQAKVAKLREELASKEEDLARMRQDHEYDEMVKALDEGLQAFKDVQDEKTRALSDSLANQEAAIENSLSWTTTQYKTTYDELAEISRSFGIDLEDFLVKPWKSATAAAKTFEEATTKAMKSNAGISTTGYQTIDKNKAADKTGSISAGNSYVESMSNPTTEQKKTNKSKTGGNNTTSGKKIAGSFSGASLWYGNTNKVSDVKYLQQLLNAIMKTNMKVDGIFGPATEAAVKAFQSKYGIGADGVFGKKSRSKMLEVAKKLGYARRGKRNARGLYITDEQGIGSEAIITKEGVLRQLDSDTVFSKKQTEALWNISKMNLDNAMKVSSRGANVNITYGSLLTVTGDVTKDALPGLEEILKKACEYTKRDITASMSKLGFR